MEAAEQDKWLRLADLEALESYRKCVGPAPVVYKADGYAKATSPGGPLTIIASEESEDRLGDIITIEGWQLDNYKKNPVILFAHDQGIPPIGLSRKIWSEGKQLLMDPRFDTEDEFARLIEGKFQRGFMRAVSVGFRAIEFEERGDGKPGPFGRGLLFKKQELVEISAVPVQAHPAALAKMLGRVSYSIPNEAYVKRLEALEAKNAPPALPDEPDILGTFRRVFKEA